MSNQKWTDGSRIWHFISSLEYLAVDLREVEVCDELEDLDQVVFEEAYQGLSSLKIDRILTGEVVALTLINVLLRILRCFQLVLIHRETSLVEKDDTVTCI